MWRIPMNSVQNKNGILASGRDVGNLQSILTSLDNGLAVFLANMILTLLVWAFTLMISFWITPYHELSQLRAGNVSVAISAGGTAVGTAIPLAVCLAGAVNGWDIIVWALPVMLVQLSAYWLTQLLIPNLGERLKQGDLAVAIFLTLFRTGFACINAAAIAS